MGINPNHLNMDTPLVRYIATAVKNGSKIQNGKKHTDIIMSKIMSKRLAIGIDEANTTYIAMQSNESYVFQEFSILEVDFVRKVMDSDWLVIVTDDASNGRGKMPKGLGDKKIPMRFWFPATNGLFDAFNGIGPDKIISFIEMNFVNNYPEASGDIFLEVPLKIRGNWEDVEIIEDIINEENIIEHMETQSIDDVLISEDNLILNNKSESGEVLELSEEEKNTILTEALFPD